MALEGLHHITAITGDAPRNVDFYARALGLRLVKKTVNFDQPDVYHLYYGDELATPGAIVTFFEFPGAAAGRHGDGMPYRIAWRVAGDAALEFWSARLDGEGIAVERAAGGGLLFADPEGLEHELVVEAVGDPPLTASAGDVPAEHALQGFAGVRAYARRPAASAGLLEALGFARHGTSERTDEAAARPAAAAERADEIAGRPGEAAERADDVAARPATAAERADEVAARPGEAAAQPDGYAAWQLTGDARRARWTYDAPPPGRGFQGAGSIHHVAWSAADDAELARFREIAAAAGARPTPIIDRQYFHSVYFREPSGVLFELASRDPGFDVDEPLESLGEALMLPPQHEARREQLEALLTPISNPRQTA